MRHWGTFVINETREVHVAPCTKEGGLDPTHTISQDCTCKPEMKTDTIQYPSSVWVHQETR